MICYPLVFSRRMPEKGQPRDAGIRRSDCPLTGLVRGIGELN